MPGSFYRLLEVHDSHDAHLICEIQSYLVLCSAQSLLDLLVALLHPHPQPAVRSGHLGDATGDLAIFGLPGTSGADVAQTRARDQPHVPDPDNPYGKFFS